MFKVASYSSFEVPDVWDVLVAKFLDSKTKTKNKKISHTINKLEKNSCYNAAFFHITSIQDLAFDNCHYYGTMEDLPRCWLNDKNCR